MSTYHKHSLVERREEERHIPSQTWKAKLPEQSVYLKSRAAFRFTEIV